MNPASQPMFIEDTIHSFTDDTECPPISVENGGDLVDVILALQLSAGIQISADINMDADINGNTKTGVAEAGYGLMKITNAE